MFGVEQNRSVGTSQAHGEALIAGVASLLTNNPEKIAQLEEDGIEVSERLAHQLPANRFNRHYLQTKALKSGHLLDPARMG